MYMLHMCAKSEPATTKTSLHDKLDTYTLTILDSIGMIWQSQKIIFFLIQFGINLTCWGYYLLYVCICVSVLYVNPLMASRPATTLASTMHQTLPPPKPKGYDTHNVNLQYF